MENYTKGEWKASHPQDNHTAFITDSNFQQKVLMSVQWGSDIPEIEQRANAHLIASAPDLYEALKGILLVAHPENDNSSMVFEKEYIGGFIVLGNRLEDAVKALSKAEGKL